MIPWRSALLILLTSAGLAAPEREAVSFAQFRVDDPFWSPRVRQIQEVTLPDLLDLAETQGKIDNFRIVAGRKAATYRTYNAADSDVYKLIEAASYTLVLRRDPALEARLDAIIADVVAAQQPDGYLNTQFTLPAGAPHMPAPEARFVQTFGFGPAGRWASRSDNWPKNYAQLYCAGHLFEAAVAYRVATGKTVLFEAALRLADHLVRQFPVNERLNYADHPEVEIGLMRLVEATGAGAYLELASHFARQVTFARPPDLGDGANLRPLAEQRVAWGHAVRTAYLYTGATEVVRHTGADDLRTALSSLWHSIMDTRLYVHGGVGGPAVAEQLQPPWLLDSATTYSETCANIAHAQWNHSLNLLSGESLYADVVEHQLYNAGLAGLGADGTTFLYSNLLAAGTVGRRNEHSGVRRRYLFCCPSKIPGFVAGIGRWIASVAPNEIALNQYVGGALSVTPGSDSYTGMRVRSGLPWMGEVEIEVTAAPVAETTLALRVPGWARGVFLPSAVYRSEDTSVTSPVGLTLNGEKLTTTADRSGYVRLHRMWRAGDRVVLSLPMPVRRIRADERAERLRGRVAVARGPVLYCLEGVDQPGIALHHVQLPPGSTFTSEWRGDLFGGITLLRAEGRTPDGRSVPLTFVPYYAWANRGVHELAVWLVEDPARAAEVVIPGAPARHNTQG